MAVNSEELKKAMDTLGISDIHIDRAQAKKIYKKLLIKWHPDSCHGGNERFYNETTAKINHAYEIIEKAYEEGLIGPDVKSNSDSRSYDLRPSRTEFNKSSREEHNSQKSDNQHKENSSQAYKSADDVKQYTSSDYYDSANGLDILYFRKRWLNIIFLTICTAYAINAIIKSSKTDIYIEKSVINLISMIAVYYAIYCFFWCFVACDGFFISGIISWIIYKAITFISMFFYKKFGANHEWWAMLLFIAVFFAAEYFVHIKKILLTFDRKIKVEKVTTFFSCFMLLEYAVLLIFGIYSVALVHKNITIRNTIIPPWY